MTDQEKAIMLRDIIKDEKLTSRVFFELEHKEINKLKAIIKTIKEDNFKTTKAKGDALEQLISLYFKKNIFEVVQNVTTNTNEIDILITLTDDAKAYKMFEIIPKWFPSEYSFIECKNYAKPLDVTYIGKFFSLIKAHNAEFGFFVSTRGITGESVKTYSWKYASGLLKKINLRFSECGKPLYILPINLNQIENNLNNFNGNIFKLIQEIKAKLDLDLDINSQIVPHPLQGKFTF